MAESELFKQISLLPSEQINPRTADIDLVATSEILEMINAEDSLVATAVKAEIPQITRAVDAITERLRSGGRLFYIGAGTSGRLGIVDASECPPTFGTNPDTVQGIIAGGRDAVFLSQEGAEDFEEVGADEISAKNISSKDVLCGLAASGRTPFVRGGIKEAKKRGAFTILISTSLARSDDKFLKFVDVLINPVVGAEAIAGSTRMKSGTAQKLVLNMLTTATMVKLGKTYSNIMVDLQQTNQKLIERSKRILMLITGVDYDAASKYLDKSDGHVKSAIIMILTGATLDEARSLLDKSKGITRLALQNANISHEIFPHKIQANK